MRSLSRITRRLTSSRAARNAAASYLAFLSISVSAFVSIPIVVRFLDKEEIGLWTVVNQVVGYLIWMDLGVANAAGRKLADAIAANDQPEINRWWTAIVAALCVLGVALIGVGAPLTPLVLSALNIPLTHHTEAIYLYLGAVLIAGLGFPIKAAPGFLTAQERFHWCPLAQAIQPWVSLGIFYLCLAEGLGVRSYIWSLAATQVFAWVYYGALLLTGPQKPAFDFAGLTKHRFRSLFGYSLNLSVLTLVESLLQSLPALILSRASGLALIPIYSFTARGPTVITGLVRRTTHAFYPALLRLHVSGERKAFRRKYQEVGLLVLAVGTVAAGFALLCNRMLVEFLAGPDFFAGHQANLWFTVAIVSAPFCAAFEILLQFSGSMGKSVIVAPLKLLLGWLASVVMYRQWGMNGIAAVFAFVPFFYGIYAYYKGCANCRYQRQELVTPLMKTGLVLLIVIALCGFLVIQFPAPGPTVIFHGHEFRMIGRGELFAAGVLIPLGLFLGLKQVRSLVSR